MMANRLGVRDIRKDKKEMEEEKMSKKDSEIEEEAQYCPCCGFVKQEDEIKLCTKLSQINNFGISTFLYFQTIKNLVVLLTILTLVYSIYALVTNIIASGDFDYKNFDFSGING